MPVCTCVFLCVLRVHMLGICTSLHVPQRPKALLSLSWDSAYACAKYTGTRSHTFLPVRLLFLPHLHSSYSHTLQGKTPDSCEGRKQTRMYVWVQQPTALLLLGLTLGVTARRLNCVKHTYPSGHKCCRECQPGHGMVSRCDHTRDTLCHPCETGFYNEAVNYDTCKQCTQCNHRSGSELKQNCTPTQDTVCRCRPGTQPRQDSGYKLGVDCVPCPPGHFSPGNNQACKPWTNCTLSGKQTRHPASDSLDAVCEDRSLLATLLWETQRPTFRPTTVQSTTVWPRTSELPSPPTLVTPEGLGLGLLAPLTVLLALYLLRKAWRLPNTPKPCWGNSFRTPIQEEHTDAHFTLAKI
ncbi:tumor necrosis factor receptor superfamily member 4 isoform X1 [Mus musculus]|uniref:tumor necrosis factor receptor superfamily member 4 isoform X1 n=1 Tax=Mus musculus TaxID=10090 RepID=UPI0003D6FEBC|nr:tumor necrosis factor receptor superfamily member 4 isoform X1 [Mus musculus]|eukprot:XP_006538787.3 PREDICTED: tumor necrosis factor receptor superfamily member 4 isoform X1 [Mus musculus]